MARRWQAAYETNSFRNIAESAVAVLLERTLFDLRNHHGFCYFPRLDFSLGGNAQGRIANNDIALRGGGVGGNFFFGPRFAPQAVSASAYQGPEKDDLITL